MKEYNRLLIKAAQELRGRPVQSDVIKESGLPKRDVPTMLRTLEKKGLVSIGAGPDPKIKLLKPGVAAYEAIVD